MHLAAISTKSALGLCLALAIVNSAPAAADEACQQLKSIVDAAKSGFAKFKGAAAAKPDKWASTMSLGDSTGCTIQKSGEMELTCDAPAFDNEKAAIEDAGRRIDGYRKCLDGPLADSDDGNWADVSHSPDRRALTGRGGVTIFANVEFDQWVDEKTADIIKKYWVETRVVDLN